MSIKFVHVADVHLDTAFMSQSTQVRQRLKRAIREAFRAAVDLTLNEGALAMVVAGDLFDGARFTLETEGFLLEQASRLQSAGVRLLYATGNHDPGLSGDRLRHVSWPPCVHVFSDGNPQTVTVGDGDGSPMAAFVGAGHETDKEQRNLASAFPGVTGSLPHIALLHTFVSGSRAHDGHERYAPSGIEDLRGKGYSYWALGHIHKRQNILQEPLAAYPGNIQGRQPREDGGKGALVVTLDSSGAQAEFRLLAPVEWAMVKPTGLAGVNNLNDLISRVVEAIPPRSAAESILRVDLSGPCPLYRELSTEEGCRSLEEDLEDAIDVLSVEVRVAGLIPPIDMGRLRQGPHVLATALEVLEEIRNGTIPPSIDQETLAGKAVGILKPGESVRDYLASIIEGLEEEMGFRMVKPDED